MKSPFFDDKIFKRRASQDDLNEYESNLEISQGDTLYQVSLVEKS